MSRIDKEWAEDRKEEAWNDINKIADLFESCKDDTYYNGYFYDKWSAIKEILEESGWI